MGGRQRKEGKVTEVRKEGKRRSEGSGWAWSPLRVRPLSLVEDLFPQPRPQCLIAMQQRKQQEMAQPHVFLHTAQPVWPGQIITLYMCGRDGAGEVYVGEGVKHKQSWPVTRARTGNSLCQLQAEVSRRDVYGGAKVFENNSPSKLGSQREGSSSVGFLWSLFRSQFH